MVPCRGRYTLIRSEGVTARETPPTARERALFEAATQGRHEEFTRLCRMIGREPRQVLDSFDAAPWRWLIVTFDPELVISDSTRELQFPTRIRARLESTREYVEMPWWRRFVRQ